VSNIQTNKTAKNRWTWDSYASDSAAARRAGGRRHYNSIRNLQRVFRRLEVIQLAGRYGGFTEYGIQARIARALGVNRSTACRDINAIIDWMNGRRPSL
jgi:hypothetical protein